MIEKKIEITKQFKQINFQNNLLFDESEITFLKNYFQKIEENESLNHIYSEKNNEKREKLKELDFLRFCNNDEIKISSNIYSEYLFIYLIFDFFEKIVEPNFIRVNYGRSINQDKSIVFERTFEDKLNSRELGIYNFLVRINIIEETANGKRKVDIPYNLFDIKKIDNVIKLFESIKKNINTINSITQFKN